MKLNEILIIRTKLVNNKLRKFKKMKRIYVLSLKITIKRNFRST